MPVRSLNSSVIKWPDLPTVDQALRKWIINEAKKHNNLYKIGYFGSYARGDWGVGSDIDLIAIVEESSEPFDRRNLSWDLREIPVAADLLIYTRQEWANLQKGGGLFPRTLQKEIIWIYG